MVTSNWLKVCYFGPVLSTLKSNRHTVLCCDYLLRCYDFVLFLPWQLEASFIGNVTVSNTRQYCCDKFGSVRSSCIIDFQIGNHT